jgi:hypothetical protein
MFDQASSPAQPESYKAQGAESDAPVQDLLRGWDILPCDMCSAAGHRHARLDVPQMIPNEVAMRKAVGIYEDQAVEAADAHGAILDASLAKAKVRMPDVLNGMAKSRRPAFEQRAVVLR